MNLFDRAKKGDKDFFKQVELDIIQRSTNEYGNSVLTTAAEYNKLDCCEEIHNRCPSLLYHQNNHGDTALHIAARNGCHKVVEFLITAAEKVERDIEEGGGAEDKKLLTMVDNSQYTALHLAVVRNQLVCAKLLVAADHHKVLLTMVDGQQETPLHIAVNLQSFDMVKLLVEAGPHLDYPVNCKGKTPSLMALDGGSVPIQKVLIEKQPSGCKVRTGDNGWTLLHHATHQGNLAVIEEIIRFCPDCLAMVDNEGRNFLHLAAKYEHSNVVTHVLGMPQISSSVLNAQDKDGNTPLHIAVLLGNTSIALPLLYDYRVDKLTVNNEGQKVLDAIKFDYDKRMARVIGVTDTVGEKEIKEQSDFDLLVGALIATVSFTAGITVPGGYTTDGPDQGTAMLSKKRSFEAFIISNTIALLLSLYAVFCHFYTKYLIEKRDIVYQLKLATFCTLGAICAMVASFITGSYTVLVVSNGLAITVCVFCSCFFIFTFRPICNIIKMHIGSTP